MEETTKRLKAITSATSNWTPREFAAARALRLAQGHIVSSDEQELEQLLEMLLAKEPSTTLDGGFLDEVIYD